MDKIYIKNLKIYAKHGVLPAEKKYRQMFLINAILFLDLRQAGKSDDLEQTINYAKIAEDIKTFVENNTFNLIETVAEKLAEKLLIENSKLQKIKIEINKPEARINAELETVSVEITRSRHTVFLSLGSNIGSRETYINNALAAINKIKGCHVVRVSDFHNTKPYGHVEQDDFLNACIEVDTILTPTELLTALKELEAEAGREFIEKWGPRTLDIDIIYYDDIVLSAENLIIPHIDMHNRDFVLIPLMEIAPNKRHPLFKKTTDQLWDELNQKNK